MYCRITVHLNDSDYDVIFEDEDAKLLLDAANIGLEEVPESVVPEEWSDRIYNTILEIQRRIEEI